MNVSELLTLLDARLLTDNTTLNNQFVDIYVGDLLSNIMANIEEDNLLVTIMCNMNTVAVASLKDVPIIVFAENKQATEEMINKANDLGIALIQAQDSAAVILRKIYTRWNIIMIYTSTHAYRHVEMC